MALIGTFLRGSDGSFTGTVRTATLLLPVEIRLDPGAGPPGPTTGWSRRARPSSGSVGTRCIRGWAGSSG